MMAQQNRKNAQIFMHFPPKNKKTLPGFLPGLFALAPPPPLEYPPALAPYPNNDTIPPLSGLGFSYHLQNAPL